MAPNNGVPEKPGHHENTNNPVFPSPNKPPMSDRSPATHKTPTTALHTSEPLFRLIVEASPAGMLIVDSEGSIVLVNPQAQKDLGYSEQELLGESVEILIPAAHAAAHQAHRARYMSHPEPRSMAAGRDLFARRKDGTEFPVDISLHPLPTDSGVMVLANILDATSRRRAEQEADQRQAMERLAMLGQLAGGVAHEIRTPLCVIRNDVYFLQTMAEQLGPEGMECIEEINQAVGKANRIVSELLDFTREPPSNPEPVAVEDILIEALADYAIPTSVTFQRPELETPLYVHADREQIARIFTNLFRNAVQAMKGQGQLTLRIEDGESAIEMDVEDTGEGISEEHRERVFEPLFTTKANGIGLGLAVSKRYALRNHGDLTLAASPDGRTCFRLRLPKASV